MAYGPSGTDATDDYVVIGTGLAAGTTHSWIEVNPPTPMRTRPSATFNTVYVFDANNRTLGSITYFSGEDGAAYRPLFGYEQLIRVVLQITQQVVVLSYTLMQLPIVIFG